MFEKISSKLSVFTTAAALTGATLPAADAQGGLMVNVANYDQHKLLSADPMYKNSVAVGRVGSIGLTYASGVLIAPDVYINSGHFTPINGSTVAFHTEIVFGENYNTSTERYSVKETQRFPGYVFGNKGTIDLGVGWTDQFVAGITSPGDLPYFAPPSSSVPEGTVLTLVDYGIYGDENTGQLPSLGDRLAGRAPKDNDSIDYSSTYYYATLFDGSTSLDILNYRGDDFASGAAWYTELGAVSGLHIASSNNVGIGVSIVLDLTHPDIQAYLQPIIQDSWARFYASQEPVNPGNPALPEPSTVALLATAGLLLGKRPKKS